MGSLFVITVCVQTVICSLFSNLDGSKFNYITVNNQKRSMVVYVPSTLRSLTKDTVVPLVVALHGTNGNGMNFASYSYWSSVSEKMKDFVVIFPTGSDGYVEDATNPNSDPCPSIPHTKDGTKCRWFLPISAHQYYRDNDVSFLEKLIEMLTTSTSSVASHLSIHKDKIILMGHSNGGYFSYYFVQSSKKTQINTIVPYAGCDSSWINFWKDYYPPPFKSSLIHIHPTKDSVVKIDPCMKRSINFWMKDVLKCSPSEIDDSGIISDSDCNDKWILRKYDGNDCGNTYSIRSMELTDKTHSGALWDSTFKNCDKTSWCKVVENGEGKRFAEAIWSEVKKISRFHEIDQQDEKDGGYVYPKKNNTGENGDESFGHKSGFSKVGIVFGLVMIFCISGNK